MADESTLIPAVDPQTSGGSELPPQGTRACCDLQTFRNALTSQQHLLLTNTEGNSEVAADSERSQCVFTPDLKEALDLLEDKGRVVLCGLPGTGKTIIGHALLRRSKMEGFKPYILSKVEEWNVHIGREQMSFVLMDGTLGETYVDKQQYHVLRSILRTVLELTDQGQCRFVLTLYPHVLRELQELETNSHSTILERDSVLNLMEQPLDKETKEEVLRFHEKK